MTPTDGTDTTTPDGDTCPLCDPSEDLIVASNDLAIAIGAPEPATRGHVLIAARRHVPDMFSRTMEESVAIDGLIRSVTRIARQVDPTVAGFTIGTDIGEVAGQRYPHDCTDVIPRRDGDHPAPRGGIRGVIPGKQDYRTAPE